MEAGSAPEALCKSASCALYAAPNPEDRTRQQSGRCGYTPFQQPGFLLRSPDVSVETVLVSGACLRKRKSPPIRNSGPPYFIQAAKMKQKG